MPKHSFYTEKRVHYSISGAPTDMLDLANDLAEMLLLWEDESGTPQHHVESLIGNLRRAAEGVQDAVDCF